MTAQNDAQERSLELLARMVREDPILTSELESSLRVFFGGPPPACEPADAALQVRRHIEWFLPE